MNERIRAIMRKEWLDLRRNKVVMGTLVALPALLTTMSCVMLVAAARAPQSQHHNPDKLPAYLAQLTSDPREATLIMLANTALMMFSMVPVILPSIMAAHSIAGEKLARSLEPLLATPIRTWELLVGKVLAIVTPALIPSLGGYAVYVAVAHAYSPGPPFEFIVSPPFLLSVAVAGPLTSILAVTFGIMVSSRTADLQSAQGLSGLIVLPVIGLGMAQTFGAISVSVAAVMVKVLALVVLDTGGLFLCVSVFERETILSRWK